jgi:hypothetical protein
MAPKGKQRENASDKLILAYPRGKAINILVK